MRESAGGRDAEPITPCQSVSITRMVDIMAVEGYAFCRLPTSKETSLEAHHHQMVLLGTLEKRKRDLLRICAFGEKAL